MRCDLLPLRLSLAGLLIACLSAGAFGRDTDLEQWQEARLRYETFIHNMKPLNIHRVTEAMELRVENKFLSLRTPLTYIQAEQSMRATFVGVGGMAIISLAQKQEAADPALPKMGPAAAPVPTEPERFNMMLMDFPAPKQTVSISVRLDSQPRQINLSKTIQTLGGGTQTITFRQERGSMLNGRDLVELQISDQPGQTVAPQTLTLTGSDFVTFVHRHPEQTEKYLRPIFRDLTQESVFAPDQMVSYQVFSELWAGNPAVVPQVQALVPMLGSSDFHQRDAATTRLVELGRDAAAVLIHLDRAHLNPEQNARIDRVVAPFLTLSTKEAIRLRSDPYFLLDCLYTDDSRLRAAVLPRLREVFRPNLQFDNNADPDTRAAEITGLRIRLLSGMR